ncbi:MAG: hypothetical protein EXS38_08725 [Opitutus sp.]|nr:hypothetical protein [Opitutus sp.]
MATFVPAEARRLLAEAGFAAGAGFPTLELLISGNDSEMIALVEAMQQMWRRELGVEVKIVSNEGIVFLDNVRSGNFQLSLSNWRYDINDPVNQFLLGTSTYPSNQTGWESADYDRAFHAPRKPRPTPSATQPLTKWKRYSLPKHRSSRSSTGPTRCWCIPACAAGATTA